MFRAHTSLKMGWVTTDDTHKGQRAALQWTLCLGILQVRYPLNVMRQATTYKAYHNVPVAASPGFPQKFSPPHPYWATVVSKTCHDLFHFINIYDFFSLFLVYLSLPCPPGKASISPMRMYLVYKVFPELSKQTITHPSRLSEKLPCMVLWLFWHYIACTSSYRVLK